MLSVLFSAVVVKLGIQTVTALPLTNSKRISSLEVGDRAVLSQTSLSIPVSRNFLGNLVDPLGNVTQSICSVPVSKEVVDFPCSLTHFSTSNLVSRGTVHSQVKTGIAALDLLFPVGHGMRIAILGHASSALPGNSAGGSNLAIEIVSNMSYTEPDTICIYCIIGKSPTEIQQIVMKLKESRAPESEDRKNLIVIASDSDSLALQYFSPFSASSIANYFRDIVGSRVVVVIDSMTSHAQIASNLTDSVREKFNLIHSSQSKILENFYQSNSEPNVSSTVICLDSRKSINSGDTLETLISRAATENLLGLVDDTIWLQKIKKKPGTNKKLKRAIPTISNYNTIENDQFPIAENYAIDLKKVMLRPGVAFQSSTYRWMLNLIQESFKSRQIESQYVTKDALEILGQVEFDSSMEEREFISCLRLLLHSAEYSEPGELSIVLYVAIKLLGSIGQVQDANDPAMQFSRFKRNVPVISDRILEELETQFPELYQSIALESHHLPLSTKTLEELDSMVPSLKQKILLED